MQNKFVANVCCCEEARSNFKQSLECLAQDLSKEISPQEENLGQASTPYLSSAGNILAFMEPEDDSEIVGCS